MKKCKECGKDFETKSPKALFCSLACRQKDYRKNKNKEFEGYRKAVAEMPKTPTQPPVEESPQIQKAPQKKNIARGLSWYISAIQGLEFPEEYKAMEEMIRADETLSKKECTDLVLAMKTPRI